MPKQANGLGIKGGAQSCKSHIISLITIYFNIVRFIVGFMRSIVSCRDGWSSWAHEHFYSKRPGCGALATVEDVVLLDLRLLPRMRAALRMRPLQPEC